MKRASAPRYDQFKMVVTLVLAAILILMLLRGCATGTVSPAPAEHTVAANPTQAITSSPVSTEAILHLDTTETAPSSPVPSAVEATITAAPVEPTPTPAPATTQASTIVPDQATPTSAQSTACNTVAQSRLRVGQKAQVVRRLNMRSQASIDAALIQTNPTNTQVEIIGGPVCTPIGDHAYLWWQIRLANGSEGWSAESPLNEATYFLEPIP